MPAPFQWGALSGATTLLSSELNSLANSSAGTLSATGAVVAATGHLYGFVEFMAGASYTPTANGFIELWLLQSIDGSNFEDGSATVAPARVADAIIPVRAGSSIAPRANAGLPPLVLPPGSYKPIARNQTGAALPSAGNLIRIAFADVQS
ncbi:MAG TPA: hypothetical protein VMC10_14190 [Stellaceae bacterium]|nr:hypothetical protein [Stellaceae bacterium]HUN46562.1 hypothetical protein [Stellaceae bacterium]